MKIFDKLTGKDKLKKKIAELEEEIGHLNFKIDAAERFIPKTTSWLNPVDLTVKFLATINQRVLENEFDFVLENMKIQLEENLSKYR